MTFECASLHRACVVSEMLQDRAEATTSKCSYPKACGQTDTLYNRSTVTDAMFYLSRC